MNRKPKVLVLCTGNSCCSQMAGVRAVVTRLPEWFDETVRSGHGD